MYLNDLFAVNTGSNSGKSQMLAPHGDIILGVTIVGIRVLAYGTEQIISASLLRALMNAPSLHVDTGNQSSAYYSTCI